MGIEPVKKSREYRVNMRYMYNVVPPNVILISVFINNMNTIVISTINHSEIGIKNQLSYLGGRLCTYDGEMTIIGMLSICIGNIIDVVVGIYK